MGLCQARRGTWRVGQAPALRALFVGLALAVLVACGGPTPTPAPPTIEPAPTADPSPTPPPITWTNPVYPADFPDPFILRVGDTYYAYATNARGMNVQVIRSQDLLTWERAGVRGDALPDLPAWAAELASLTWAPSVLARGNQYILYYVARDIAGGRQCISYAVSDRPDGPFMDPNPDPWICPLALGGAIDPEPFVDQDGALYLLYKNDGNCCGLSVRLYSQRLSEDGRTLVDEPVALIAYDQEWERPLIENPSMVWHEGHYYLIYSANWYEGRDYAVGYALCDSVTGPCTKPLNGPVLASAGAVAGPGGASFFRAGDGALWIAYHAWTEPVVGYSGGKRSLHLARVGFWQQEIRFYRPEAALAP